MRLIRLLLTDIAAVAPRRPPAYITALMTAGIQVDGWLELPEPDYMRIREQFGTPTDGPTSGCGGCGRF